MRAQTVVSAFLLMVHFAISTAFAGGGGNNPGRPPAGLAAEEWSTISEQMLAEDYAVTRSANGAYLSAVNPAQALELRFGNDGLGLASIPERASFAEPSAESAHLSTVAIGRSSAMRSLHPVTPQAVGNRVEYRYEGVTEWYVNRTQGLEHGYTLDQRPEGEAGEIQIAVQLGGDLTVKPASEPEGLLFRHAGSGRTLRYHKLLVADARGAKLPARLIASAPDRFQIAFDDATAVYPITVDPLLVSEDAKIISEGDGGPSLYFGTAVALDGDTLLVGRPENFAAGSAYVFVRSGGTWIRQAKLTRPDELDQGPSVSTAFGSYVALSGDTAVIGESASGGGDSFVHVYVRSGERWTYQATLRDVQNRRLGNLKVAVSGDTVIFSTEFRTESGYDVANVYVRSGETWTAQALLSVSDVGPFRGVGGAIALSGDTALIGAPDSVNDGAAYVFQRVGTTWTQQAKLLPAAPNGRFGLAVALEGDVAVVGAPNDASNVGAAYVFQRAGGTWTLFSKLVAAADGTFGGLFGNSAGISGNTIVIGRGFDSFSGGRALGSAHVFVRTGSTFAQQAKLLGIATDSPSLFGSSVSIQGNTIVASAPQEDVGVNARQGTAYVFNRTGSTWNQQTKLTASDGASNDNFGTSVALDGDTLLVGADTDSVGALGLAGNANGSAHVFIRSGADWVPQARLLPSNLGASARFGWSVALDGDTAVVGALEEPNSTNGDGNRGAAYVFARTGEDWIEQARFVSTEEARGQFGSSVAIEGDTAVVGAAELRAGGSSSAVAYIFQRSGNVWVRQAKLLPPQESDSASGYVSVSLSGDTVLLGNFANGLGEAYVFVRSGNVWTTQATLRAAERQTNANFGVSVSLDGNTALIGASNIGGGGGGTAFVFVRNGTTWTEQTKLENPDPLSVQSFGISVALLGDVAAIGATREGFDKGSAYVFVRSGATWTESMRLVASDGRGGEGAGGDSLGKSVALSGNSVVVGAHKDTNSSGRNAGAVYVYRLADTLDFGDAPAPYPTLLANDGARHTVGNLYLGLTVDTDPDGRPNSGATGDDIADTDDEDGVSFPGGLDPGSPATLQVFVTGAPALLDAWLDFNADGDWNDAGERIANHYIVMPGDNAVAFDVPASATTGLRYARVRLSSAGVNAPTGPAPDGEVEDEIVGVGPPTLSIGDVARAEGNSGTTSFAFPVSLSRSLPDSVFVDYATVVGTAGTDDFVATSGTLEIPAGSTSASLTVQVRGDTTFEPDQRFTLQLANPVNASLSDATATGTIQNDDARPTVVLLESARAVQESGGAVSVGVQLSAASSEPVSVPFTVSGTASSADYSGLSASLISFAPGATSATINLALTNDTLDEPDETLVLTLGNPVNATRGTPAAFTLTIQDDDVTPQPTGPQVFFATGDASLNEAPTRVTKPCVCLTAPSSLPVTVPIIYSGTATLGQDFTGPSQVTIPAGAIRTTLNITLRNDTLDESTETIVATFGTPTNATLGTRIQRTIQIIDDDPTPLVFFRSRSADISEGDGLIMGEIQLRPASGRDVVVNFARLGSVDSADFTALTASPITIRAGATKATFSFVVTDDQKVEGTETLVLRLTSALNATLRNNNYVATIRDYDGPPTIRFETDATSASEASGTVNLKLLLSRPTRSAASVNFLYLSGIGGAIRNRDYSGPTTLTVPAGRTSAEFPVRVIDDTIRERNEQVGILARATSGLGVANPKGSVLTIVDND